MFIKKINPELQESLEDLGIEKATDFQKKAISRIKSGLDLLAIADEDIGKTTTYIVALIAILKKAVADVPRAMVVCKDKDAVLALQERCELLGYFTDLRFHVGFDGANILNQKDTIYFGTDVVIGTPKRISELMSIEGINFSDIQTLIIDDAFAIMKHTNLTFIHRITESLPKAQKVIFTDKINDGIERYKTKYMKNTLVLKNQTT